MRPSVSSISARVSTAEPSALSSLTFGWCRLRRSSPALVRPTPMYCGAFWIATGKGDASATWPKKPARWSSLIGAPVRGGCRITQSAPAAAAASTNALCSCDVSPNTVIASGSRPFRSSATQSSTRRRSSAASLATSVPRPSAAMPCAPAATQCSTCVRMAPRSSPPCRSKNA